MKLLLLFSLFFLSFVSLSQSAALSIGKLAPMQEHKMDASQKEKFSMKDLMKENGLIVIFSSNTCPFVVGFPDSTFPGWENQYNAINKVAQAKQIGVVLINSNEAKRENGESLTDIAQRRSLKNFNMPYLLDKNSELANAFGAKTTPHVFFFDKDFKLIFSGSIDNSFEDKRIKEIPFLINAIEKHASGKKIKLNATSPKGCSIKRLKS